MHFHLQVHRARLLDGTEVAVKVQYPGLKWAITADLLTLWVLAKTSDFFFPDAFNFGWLVPELSKVTIEPKIHSIIVYLYMLYSTAMSSLQSYECRSSCSLTYADRTHLTPSSLPSCRPCAASSTS